MHRHMHAGLPILPLVLRYLPWADLRRFARTLRGGEREERLLRQHVQGRRVARFVAAMHRSAPWRDTKAHPLGDYNPGRATMWSRSHVGYQYDRRLLLRFMAQDEVYRRRDARTQPGSGAPLPGCHAAGAPPTARARGGCRSLELAVGPAPAGPHPRPRRDRRPRHLRIIIRVW